MGHEKLTGFIGRLRQNASIKNLREHSGSIHRRHALRWSITVLPVPDGSRSRPKAAEVPSCMSSGRSDS